MTVPKHFYSSIYPRGLHDASTIMSRLIEEYKNSSWDDRSHIFEQIDQLWYAISSTGGPGLMAPPSVFEKAAKTLGCHPYSPILVLDAYALDDGWCMNAVCSRCMKSAIVYISKKEYNEICDKTPRHISLKEDSHESTVRR